jgi:hypothetical protein
MGLGKAARQQGVQQMALHVRVDRRSSLKQATGTNSLRQCGFWKQHKRQQALRLFGAVITTGCLRRRVGWYGTKKTAKPISQIVNWRGQI